MVAMFPPINESSEKLLSLSDYTPAYRRQGFQKMIPQIFLYLSMHF
jgi:hypothetical protein